MSGIDSRIVTMKFDNAKFERDAAQTMSTMDKLKAKLSFSGVADGIGKVGTTIGGIFSRLRIGNPFSTAQKGVADLQASSNGFHLRGMEGAVTGISKSFVAMSTIAITAISNIVNRAVDAGVQMGKALTVDPIKGGLGEYETNLNSIQTILANTQASGATLKDVNAALNELNHYSDKTIYNFSEMAKNIGTFTAAGVDLDTSTQSIKGIANLAALSGSNSQQAATAMYQLSQAIAAGKVGLQDWNSVVNAGMGGATFQRALAQTAVAMGVIDEKAVTLSGKMKNVTVNGQSFRESIMARPGEQSWLTSEVLTSTLKQFTGDMTDAQLATMGFTAEQIKSIQTQAKTATEAATKVKTLTALIDTAKEVAGSGWAATWQLIFGDFEEARTFFTNASERVNGFIGANADARNKVLGDWKELGGRSVLIEGVGNVFKALASIITPIRDAFRDIFPAKTGQDLYNLTVQFRDFFEAMKVSETTAQNIRRTFAGVFAVFSIAIQVVKGVIGVILDLAGAMGAGNGGILEFTGGIGDFLVALDDAIKNGGLLNGFFAGLKAVLEIPVKILSTLVGLFGSLFSGFSAGKAEAVANGFGRIGDELSPLERLADGFSTALDKLEGVAGKVVFKIGQAFSGVGEAILNAFNGETFDRILKTLNTGFFGVLALSLKKLATDGIGASLDVTNGAFEQVGETLGAVTDTLTTMQQSLKADVLLKIALALAALTASIVVLSLIPGDKLAKAMVGVGVGFGILIGALVLMGGFLNTFSAVKLTIMATAILILAGAMLVLSGAIAIMGNIPLGNIIRGVVGMGLALAVLVPVMKKLAPLAPGMTTAAFAIGVMATAMVILANAVEKFGSLSLTELAKGLGGLAASLGILIFALQKMPVTLVAQAFAIGVLAVALNVLASAVEKFGSLSLATLAKGLIGVAGALGIIVVAMKVMPPNMAAQAASLVLLAIALNGIAKAVEKMGGMSMQEIGRGLITLAGALLILAAGLSLMTGTGAGAASLMAAAIAISVLAPAIALLGSLSIQTIVTALVALAATFAILGAAAFILAPVAPVVLALGAALLMIGGALALAGAGILAIATAFGIVAAVGTAGIAVMAGMLATFTQALPAAIAAFGAGVVAFAAEIGKGSAQFAAAFAAIIGAILDGIITNTPKIGQAFNALLDTALNVVVTNSPKIINAGFRLIIDFLSAIERNIGKITHIASSIVVKFLDQLGKELPRMLDAGARFIIRFINGLAETIRNNKDDLGKAGKNLGSAIIEGMISGISGGLKLVKDAAKAVAKSALNAAMDFLGVNSPSKEFIKIGMYSDQGFAIGFRSYSGVVESAASGVAENALDTIKYTMRGLGDAVSGDINLDPVITPVLDLTKLSAEANKISSLIDSNPVQTGVSLGLANSIADDRRDTGDDSEGLLSGGSVVNLTLNQTNNSPKAIDPIDNYRNTRNLLTLAKNELEK